MKKIHLCLYVVLVLFLNTTCKAEDEILVPQIDGPFWQIAGNPDLGSYTSPKQQPVDFAIWRAADGTWQLWSCIRSTKLPGKTRVFYRWQANNLTDTNWAPMGIAMLSDPGFGEAENGLQAPFVIKRGQSYFMFYGDWEHISMAVSKDGKTFARQLMPDGKSGLFTEGIGANTRDPMVLKIGDRYHLYYTAYPNNRGADYVRTSSDLIHWGSSKVVSYGGKMGNGKYSAECPFVYYHQQSRYYYLLRNQFYGDKAQFAIYRSKDPNEFGYNDDSKFVATMPYAAPEIVEYQRQTYIAVLRGDLKGIQIAKLKWSKKD